MVLVLGQYQNEEASPDPGMVFTRGQTLLPGEEGTTEFVQKFGIQVTWKPEGPLVSVRWPNGATVEAVVDQMDVRYVFDDGTGVYRRTSFTAHLTNDARKAYDLERGGYGYGSTQKGWDFHDSVEVSTQGCVTTPARYHQPAT